MKSQLTVRAGDTERGRMVLSPGEVVGPMSVGTDGTWKIAAAGVYEEHGFIYFNGTELFLQSAEPQNPLLVNGAPIPAEWTPVYAPCDIQFGAARLHYGIGETHASRPAPPPPPPRSVPPPRQHTYGGQPERPFAPGALASRDKEESVETRILSVEVSAQRVLRADPVSSLGPQDRSPPPGPPSVPAPSFGAPPPSFGSAPPPSFGAPPAGPMMPAPGPQHAPMAPPVAAAQTQQSWAVARWKEASGPQKAMVVLLLPLIASVWIIFTDPPPKAPVRTKPAASASTAATASATANTPPVAPPPETAAPAATATPSAAPAASAAAGAKTPQREAADAVARGAFDEAAKLYDGLAKAHPDVPAYAEAARIMKAKTKR